MFNNIMQFNNDDEYGGLYAVVTTMKGLHVNGHGFKYVEKSKFTMAGGGPPLKTQYTI